MKFSIIIPVYNKAPYLGKTLASVFSQTCKDWELIVVDDGSTDNSVKIVEQYFEKFQSLSDNLYLICQENAGVSIARNRGVDVANGEYVCFLDADDWWCNNYLEEIDALSQKYPQAALLACDYFYVKHFKCRRTEVAFPTDFSTGLIDYIHVYANSAAMPIWTGAASVRKDVFLSLNGFNPQLVLGEDFDLWLRIALQYPVAYTYQPLAYYNQDIDKKNRAIGKLHNPINHFIWNLEYLAEKEIEIQDLKKLLDKLRVYSLYPYYLSSVHRADAKKELAKVDWTKQPAFIQKQYTRPVWRSKISMQTMSLLAKMKSILLSIIRR